MGEHACLPYANYLPVMIFYNYKTYTDSQALFHIAWPPYAEHIPHAKHFLNSFPYADHLSHIKHFLFAENLSMLNGFKRTKNSSV